MSYKDSISHLLQVVGRLAVDGRLKYLLLSNYLMKMPMLHARPPAFPLKRKKILGDINDYNHFYNVILDLPTLNG